MKFLANRFGLLALLAATGLVAAIHIYDNERGW